MSPARAIVYRNEQNALKRSTLLDAIFQCGLLRSSYTYIQQVLIMIARPFVEWHTHRMWGITGTLAKNQAAEHSTNYKVCMLLFLPPTSSL